MTMCACGHGAHAHTAPAGPCALCPPLDAPHRYEPVEPQPVPGIYGPNQGTQR